VPDTAGHGLRITKDGKVLIANGSMYNLTAFFSLPDMQSLGWIPVGTDPNWVTLTPDGKHAYLAGLKSPVLSVVDCQTQEIVANSPDKDSNGVPYIKY